MLVELPNGDWVNPAHVAGLTVERDRSRKTEYTWLHLAKASSFHVQAVRFDGDQREELAKLLNRGEVLEGHNIAQELGNLAYGYEPEDKGEAPEPE